MNKKILGVVLGLFLMVGLGGNMAMASSYGGGFHSSSSSFHSSGSFSGGSHSYGGGFSSGSSYHSSGSFSSPSVSHSSSYGGGFSAPVRSSGTFSATPKVSTPKVVATPPVRTPTMTTAYYAHTSYVYYHPYAYYWNPFVSDWFMWYWIFGNHQQNVQPQTTIINNTTCTPTKDVPCPAAKEETISSPKK
jgi:hypothetical protein